MRYVAIFATASDRATVAAWLAGVFGDEGSGTGNLGVPLIGPEGSAWFGGCAATTPETIPSLEAGTAGATSMVSDPLDENDPGAPARWWLAQAAASGLTRPASAPED